MSSIKSRLSAPRVLKPQRVACLVLDVIVNLSLLRQPAGICVIRFSGLLQQKTQLPVAVVSLAAAATCIQQAAGSVPRRRAGLSRFENIAFFSSLSPTAILDICTRPHLCTGIKIAFLYNAIKKIFSFRNKVIGSLVL